MIEFDPHLNLQKIVLVGLGGTGSQWARSLARIIFDMQRRNINTPEILFVDPDIVEEKNVGRQMFTASDVGQYKAELLARRFNYALGLNISWRNEPLSKDWFKAHKYNGDIVYGDASKLMILGAVDNHIARAEISQIDAVWIDAGNHFSSGQVVCGNTGDWKLVRQSLKEAFEKDHRTKKPLMKMRHMPNAAALFPTLLQPEDAPVVELSCADLVALGDQHLLINDTVANIAAAYTFKLLMRQPVKSFITYVDIDGMTTRSVPITQDDLIPYLPEEAVA